MADPKPPSQLPIPAYYYEREDEISLIDLWLILAKRKTVIFATVLLCLVAAIAVTFILPEKTTYTTSIQIGGGADPIESSDDVMAKLQENYIPLVINQTGSKIEVETRAPKGSSLIILESTAAVGRRDELKDLHAKIGALLVNNHAEEIAARKTVLDNQVDALNQTLDSLKNSAYLASLQNQITDLRSQLSSTNNNQDEVLRNSLRLELSGLQADLAKENQAQLLKQIEIRSSIAALQAKMNALPNTRLLATALDTKKSSVSPLLAIALGLILGIMLGVFMAFLAEFFSKVKAAQAETVINSKKG